MRLVIANSALRASLDIYHLISNARSCNQSSLDYCSRNEMNASKAAPHKIFHRKPSFVDKKMYPKSRFCGLIADEIHEILDKAVPETTKKATKFGLRLFNGTYLLSFP